jgi:hypothetical protein
MKRFVIVAVLACGGLMASPVPASASLMDWLQELSGPGPFNAKDFNLIVDVCPTGHIYTDATRSELNIFASDYDKRNPEKPQICLFIDYRRLRNDGAGDNFGAGTIDVQTFEFGASARLHRSVSIGFGIGRIGFDSQKGGEPAKLLVTAPRIVFKPALIFGRDEFWDRQNKFVKAAAGIFKFYIKNNIIVGKLTGADFGLSPGDANFNFAVSHDRVWSSGFVLDFTDVLALWL